MNEKVKGVYLDKRHNTWTASITLNGKNKHLGNFKTKDEAIAARKAGEIEYGYVPVTPAPKLKHRDDLTQEMLKERFHYHPETGIFTWKVKPAANINIGSVAGSINGKGYIHIRIDYKEYKAHRLAFLYMDGKFPEEGLDVDHINQKKDDNKWSNLRIVTRQGNQRNCPRRIDNKSGCVGVFLDKRDKIWRASISIAGERIHLGSFDNYEEAVKARKAAELKYNYHENHGKLNQNQIKEVI